MTWRGRSPAPSRSPSHPRPPYPAVHRQGARKGRYITRVFVSSSMGPGIELELPSVLPGGARFVNELAPRDKVVEAQLASNSTEFAIVLNAAMASEAPVGGVALMPVGATVKGE
mgnify:CR=1 FL=1